MQQQPRGRVSEIDPNRRNFPRYYAAMRRAIETQPLASPEKEWRRWQIARHVWRRFILLPRAEWSDYARLMGVSYREARETARLALRRYLQVRQTQ